MTDFKEAVELIDEAGSITIVQGENPDGDSLASALALEQIFGDLGKETHLYCAVAIPRHLRYLTGWDRVTDEMPKNFDLSVVVDTSQSTLLEKTFSDEQLPVWRSRPMVLLDHHDVEVDMPFQTLPIISTEAVATGELIYELANFAGWTRNDVANNMLAVSIMYDSLGMTTQGTTPASIRVIADLVEAGVSLAVLEQQRREMNRRSLEITQYKGRLLQRVEVHCDNRLATIHIPWEEIQEYSDQYNPSMLVIDEMRLIHDVEIAVALKTYPDSKVTAKIRCNVNSPIAGRLAEYFGGGGHEYAAGFKIQDGTSLETLMPRLTQKVRELLDD